MLPEGRRPMVQGLWSGNLSHCIAGKFMAVVLSQGSVKALLSDDHFLGRACFDEDRGQAGLHGSAAMRRTPRPRILMLRCTASGRARRPSLPIWARSDREPTTI